MAAVLLVAVGGLPTSARLTTLVGSVTSPQHFHLVYGASVADGDITFYNRSLNISGSVKAVSDSRTVEFVGYNANGSCYFDTTRTASADNSLRYGFGETCDVAGGFTEVGVYFPV